MLALPRETLWVTRSLARLSATVAFAYVLRGSVLSIPFTFLEVCLVATLVAYVVEKRRAGEALPDPRPQPYFWPVTLLVAAAAIAVVTAPDIRAAAGIFKAYFLEPALVAYVLADILRSRHDIEKLVGAFFTGAILVSVFEILVFLWALGLHRPHLVEQPPVVIYLSPNATGLYLGPLLALAAAMVFFGNRSERIRGAFFALWALPAFILSFSRGAWLGLVVALLFLAWHHRARLLAGGAIVLAVAGAVLIPPIRRRVATQFDPNDPFNTVNLRRNLWGATLKMQSDVRHALFGTGLSGFKHDIVPFRGFTGYSEDLIYPHNIFLNFWTETGLLGLVAFTWLAVDWIRRCRRALALKASPRRVYYLGLAAASITILVHGMLDVPFFKNDLSFLFMAILGMQAAALAQEK